ncbi:hypothetical protein NL676_013342 [Syzygium grande]|nr:hypothetical protein NL676_013342 [Syzygium grande]
MLAAAPATAELPLVVLPYPVRDRRYLQPAENRPPATRPRQLNRSPPRPPAMLLLFRSSQPPVQPSVLFLY